MKQVLVSLALVATISVVSCKNINNTEAETQTEEVALTHYQCPMKCEGDKTYTDKDTKCPVCGMALREVEKEEK